MGTFVGQISAKRRICKLTCRLKPSDLSSPSHRLVIAEGLVPRYTHVTAARLFRVRASRRLTRQRLYDKTFCTIELYTKDGKSKALPSIDQKHLFQSSLLLPIVDVQHVVNIVDADFPF